MRLHKLDKAVFRMKNNAAQFLNGLTANTFDRPRNAFLDIHGKIIATFDQIKISDDEVLVVVENKIADALLSHLDRYARLSGVVIQKEDYQTFFDLDADAPLGPGDFAIVQKRGRLLVTRKDLKANVSDDEFTLFRLKNNIPWHGIDYRDDFLLNVSEEEFVSFTKGCFLGQEPVSKVHSRSKPSWKLVVKAFDKCSPEERNKMTSRISDPETKKEIGFVFVSNK